MKRKPTDSKYRNHTAHGGLISVARSVVWDHLDRIFALVAIGISIFSLCQSDEALDESRRQGDESRRQGIVNAEATIHSLLQDYLEKEEEITAWEDSRGYLRERAPVDSVDDLESVLLGVHPSARIVRLYKSRLATYQSLTNLAEVTRDLSPRVREHVGELPKPALPSGQLPPMRVASPGDLFCYFGGTFGPCRKMIRDGVIKTGGQLIGGIEVPFRIHEEPSGLVFDLEVRDGGETIGILERNRWRFYSQRFRVATSEDTVEVVDEEGIPWLQFHFDESAGLLVFGGRLQLTSGESVAAFPDRLVTRHFLMKGVEVWDQGTTLRSIGPIKDFESEVRSLPTWFDYGGDTPRLRPDAFCLGALAKYRIGCAALPADAQ